MSIYQVFVINRAGSLIYDWDGKEDSVGVEKTFSYPLDIVLDVLDQKVTVVFGERDGGWKKRPTRPSGEVAVRFVTKARKLISTKRSSSRTICYPITSSSLKYTVCAINGTPVQGSHIVVNGSECNVIDYLSEESNFPVIVRFMPPTISTNEKIILSSTFHSLFTIAAQLSPVPKSSGIEVLTTTQFKLHCFQSTSGVKFVVVGTAGMSGGVEGLLRRIYELYADYALKNPFYSMDMPIRCQRFDDAIRNLIEKHDKHNMSEGDLTDHDTLAASIQKILRVGAPLSSMMDENFELLTVSFSDYFFTVTTSGPLTFIVKRKPPATPIEIK
ncbi:Trafficking protein particle complex subunit 4 [Toxocara canis]|uniref:Trafficking protein particle complex subunit 4 n=1 Tax=Toxocara canis TaxID=6265 RepID=A0A0B2VHQ6_TOXCA|nr:Trafficking protein particle complex subunit 4 [Toxocara canis]